MAPVADLFVQSISNFLKIPDMQKKLQKIFFDFEIIALNWLR